MVAISLPISVYDWSVDDVANWVRYSLKMSCYNHFKKNGINGLRLILCSEYSLRRLGIKNDDEIARIFAHICSLQVSNPIKSDDLYKNEIILQQSDYLLDPHKKLEKKNINSIKKYSTNTDSISKISTTTPLDITSDISSRPSKTKTIDFHTYHSQSHSNNEKNINTHSYQALPSPQKSLASPIGLYTPSSILVQARTVSNPNYNQKTQVNFLTDHIDDPVDNDISLDTPRFSSDNHLIPTTDSPLTSSKDYFIVENLGVFIKKSEAFKSGISTSTISKQTPSNSFNPPVRSSSLSHLHVNKHGISQPFSTSPYSRTHFVVEGTRGGRNTTSILDDSRRCAPRPCRPLCGSPHRHPRQEGAPKDLRPRSVIMMEAKRQEKDGVKNNNIKFNWDAPPVTPLPQIPHRQQVETEYIDPSIGDVNDRILNKFSRLEMDAIIRPFPSPAVRSSRTPSRIASPTRSNRSMSPSKSEGISPYRGDVTPRVELLTPPRPSIKSTSQKTLMRGKSCTSLSGSSGKDEKSIYNTMTDRNVKSRMYSKVSQDPHVGNHRGVVKGFEQPSRYSINLTEKLMTHHEPSRNGLDSEFGLDSPSFSILGSFPLRSVAYGSRDGDVYNKSQVGQPSPQYWDVNFATQLSRIHGFDFGSTPRDTLTSVCGKDFKTVRNTPGVLQYDAHKADLARKSPYKGGSFSSAQRFRPPPAVVPSLSDRVQGCSIPGPQSYRPRKTFLSNFK